jgi:hypothetical protein
VFPPESDQIRSMMIVSGEFLVTLFPSGAAAQDTLSTAFFIMLFISPSVMWEYFSLPALV